MTTKPSALPSFDGLVRSLANLGLDVSGWTPDFRASQAIEQSELSYWILVQTLESRLPSEFPVELLGSIETLGDLYEFARVKFEHWS